MREVRASSSRPRVHDRSTSSEQEVFAATERLLSKVSARDLSVAEIIEEANVSRGTFYHYFSSTWDVINELATSAMEDIYAWIELFVIVDEEVPRQEALRRSIEQGCAVWGERRAVLRVIVEHWREVPQLRTMWLTALDRIRDGIAAEIDRERAAGLAPPGPDSRQLVATLLWATANCLYIAGLDDIEDLPSETEISESIVALWLRTLYEAERSDLARGPQHQDGHDPVPNEEDRGRHVDGHQAVVRERPGLEEQG
jgi:TetR/AcrR family transcriptional regulator, ethionamide resistance regulator